VPRAIAIALLLSALALGFTSTRAQLDTPGDGLDGAARRFAGLRGLEAAAAAAAPTAGDRYAITLPAAGSGRIRPAVARMYIATALLPATAAQSRADGSDVTVRVVVANDGGVTIERGR
jgi:hypothetical protein